MIEDLIKQRKPILKHMIYQILVTRDDNHLYRTFLY